MGHSYGEWMRGRVSEQMHDKTKGWRVRRMHEWMGGQTGRRVDRRLVLIRQTWMLQHGTLQAHLCELFSPCSLTVFSPLFLFRAQRMLIRLQTFLYSLSGVINPLLSVMGPRPLLLESNDFTDTSGPCWPPLLMVGVSGKGILLHLSLILKQNPFRIFLLSPQALSPTSVIVSSHNSHHLQ